MRWHQSGTFSYTTFYYNLHRYATIFALPAGSVLILIVVIILLLFGGRKIPELMRGIGKGISEYKHAKDEPNAADSPETPPSK